jgi:exodeoxyribonuclease VII large subunit
VTVDRRGGGAVPNARIGAHVHPSCAPGPPVLSVTELNRRARALLESEFELLWVGGELSNVTLAGSGHLYFTLKDPAAQVKCAMFRGRAQHLDWKPEAGERVEVRARVTLYEARGDYQLVVEQMRRGGLGALFEAFEKLKARLSAEGLFDEDRKRALPEFPRAIGIVTSPAAAALRDVLTTLKRRAPMIPVILYPAQVQGALAAPQIAKAIESAGRRNEVDVLIVCRGGGSLEDLWPFNEEVVARAIAASPIPVVSGVGHETDFSIADFVADLRAPTPTAAATAASPDREALAAHVAKARAQLAREMRRGLEQRMQMVDSLAKQLVTPAERVKRMAESLAALRARLSRALQPALRDRAAGIASARDRLRLRLDLAMRDRHARVAAAGAALSHLDPGQVLARGYAIVRAADGSVVRSSAQLAVDEAIDLRFAAGAAAARVISKT